MINHYYYHSLSPDKKILTVNGYKCATTLRLDNTGDPNGRPKAKELLLILAEELGYFLEKKNSSVVE